MHLHSLQPPPEVVFLIHKTFSYHVLPLLLLREGIWLFVPDIGFHGFLLSLSAAIGRKQTCEASDCLVLLAIYWRRRNNNSWTQKLKKAADAKGKSNQ